MPYYRHTSEKILYALTDNPSVRANTHKGHHSGWTISGTLETFYAENPIDPKTKKLTKPTIKAAVSTFEAKDSKDEALEEYFRRWQPEHCTEIPAAEYHQLREAYSSAPTSPE